MRDMYEGVFVCNDGGRVCAWGVCVCVWKAGGGGGKGVEENVRMGWGEGAMGVRIYSPRNANKGSRNGVFVSPTKKIYVW